MVRPVNGLPLCNSLCKIYNRKIIKIRNAVFNFMISKVKHMSYYSWIKIKNFPDPCSPRIGHLTREWLELELGPLKRYLNDVRQTTLARLPENVMLSGLASISTKLLDIPPAALLSTFTSMCRLCRLYGIRFYINRGYIQCLTCLRHVSHGEICSCRIYSFDTIEVLPCSCDGLICCCDEFPAAPLILDEIDRLNLLVYGPLAELIDLSADDSSEYDKISDVRPSDCSIFIDPRTQSMLIWITAKSDLRPP